MKQPGAKEQPAAREMSAARKQPAAKEKQKESPNSKEAISRPTPESKDNEKTQGKMLLATIKPVEDTKPLQQEDKKPLAMTKIKELKEPAREQLGDREQPRGPEGKFKPDYNAKDAMNIKAVAAKPLAGELKQYPISE